ncbi:MAG: corrinoid protein [Anaerolineaceae bacterium]|nr:corrinoid protein [Anaerolineaceae bacterium]MBN2677495.1 corrinoid protein [Anaerolineaceae bacterium]
MEKILVELHQAIIDGAREITTAKVQAALDTDIEAGIILNKGMVSAMTEVGRLFEVGEYFVPEMLISARAMQAGLNVLRPALVQAEVKAAGKVVIGTVKGDLHDIGKNLVSMMLEGASFEIIDLGTDVPSEIFVAAVQEHRPQLVGLSAMLSTTMPYMASTIEALKTAGLREQVRVMVGGAPVTAAYAREIGADGSAPDASQAVKLAISLMGKDT